jgi:two-component system, chemotaxis family, CheB/CheR fusion protein
VHHLARELTLAEQRERLAIAQILHDELQQTLFGLQLNLRLLETRHGSLDEAGLHEAYGTLHDLVSDAILSTRSLTVDLSPPILPDDGLVEALHWLAEHMEQRFGLRVEVRAPRTVAAPSEEMRSLLFQTTREFLFNVVKHAGTDRAFVRVYEKDGHLIVDVRDEGAGFVLSDAAPLGGFGLRRARERLLLFGGRTDVRPGAGGGTRATVSLPLD